MDLPYWLRRDLEDYYEGKLEPEDVIELMQNLLNEDVLHLLPATYSTQVNLFLEEGLIKKNPVE